MNTYLFLAYTLFWLIFMAYAWNLGRRQARLQKELEELKRQFHQASSGDSPIA